MVRSVEITRRKRGFAGNEKGNVAMLFALSCLVIFPVVGFAIDFSRVMVDKHKLQMATDAAVLAAAHDYRMTVEERRATVEAHLDELESQLGRPISYTMTQDADGKISLVTNLRVNTTIAQITGRENVDVSVRADAVEGGADIEVALILDNTGSMAGSRITALRQAANDFVDIVVQDEQTPYYSKAAVVPYAVAINVGSSLAPNVRGAVTPGRSISGAAWQDGATRTMTGATRANPVVITSNAHGFVTGDRVRITGVVGMTQLNNNIYTVTLVNANQFRLTGVNGSSYGNYSSGGQIRKCFNTNCEVTVTANSHGLSNNDYVVISGVNGMTQINTGTNATWQVMNVTSNTFALVGSNGPSYSAYTSGGTSFCTAPGCQYYRFLNASSNAQRVHTISNCVTERTGVDAYTDVAPSTNLLGRNYPSTANPCATAEFMPLTNNKSALTTRINSMVAAGSTAGHLGVAWGWYALSPNFGYLFPTASRPAAYGRPKLHKFAVLMTDGEYNSSYCNGVISRTSTSGSGSTNDQINCTAPNGHSFDQALLYCEAMKDAGITVYTIGFEVVADPRATQLVNQCATNSSYVYMANNNTQLREVFQQIGNSINEVRLVK